MAIWGKKELLWIITRRMKKLIGAVFFLFFKVLTFKEQFFFCSSHWYQLLLLQGPQINRFASPLYLAPDDPIEMFLRCLRNTLTWFKDYGLQKVVCYAKALKFLLEITYSLNSVSTPHYPLWQKESSAWLCSKNTGHNILFHV